MRPDMIKRAVVALPASAALLVPLVGSTAPADAAGSTRSTLSLAAPSAAPYGSKIALRGTLSKRGTSTRIAGARVYLQRSLHGQNRWAAITSTLTSRTGGYAFTVTQGRPFDYRTTYAGSAVYTRAVSPTRYPVVGQKVLLRSLRDAEPYGGFMSAEGVRYPAAPLSNGTIYLQRYNSGKRAWLNVGFGRVRANGTFRIDTDRPVVGGAAYFRVFAPAQRGYGAGASAARRFTHYAPRGAFVKPILATGGTNRPMFDPLLIQEDPRQRTAVAFANDNGTAWADINVVGCKAVLFGAHARNDGQVKLSVLAGASTLGSYTFAPHEETLVPELVSTGGRSRVRIQMSDVSSTRPYLVVQVEPICAN